MKSKSIIVLLLILIFTMGITISSIGQESEGLEEGLGEGLEEGLEVAPEESEEKEEIVVATVDGEDLYMAELEEFVNLQGIKMALQQNPGFHEFLFNSPEGHEFLIEFKEDQLKDLIAQKLLENKVDEEEIELTEEEEDEFFQEQLDFMKKQQEMSEEELLSLLEEQGIESIDEFKELFLSDFREDLKIEKLVEEVVLDEVEVTEEEAKEIFEEEYQEQNPFLQFDQIKDDLVKKIARDRYIETLKDDADIEIFEDKIEALPPQQGQQLPM